MAYLCGELERVGKEKAFSKGKKYLEELEQEYERVKEFLENEITLKAA